MPAKAGRVLFGFSGTAGGSGLVLGIRYKGLWYLLHWHCPLMKGILETGPGPQHGRRPSAARKPRPSGVYHRLPVPPPCSAGVGCLCYSSP